MTASPHDAFGQALAANNGVTALHQLFRYVALVSDGMQFGNFRATLRDLAAEAEGIAVTIAEEMRKKGREEGRVEVLRTILSKLVILKFGDVARQDARIENLSVVQLTSAVERVLSASRVDAVIAP